MLIYVTVYILTCTFAVTSDADMFPQNK